MRLSTEFGSIHHLVERFFGALSRTGPPPAEEAWALGFLVPGERQLWEQMSAADRRHAVGVARDVLVLLRADSAYPDPPGREVLAAALLHDVGKVRARLGTFSRAGVTLAAIGFGRSRLVRGTRRASKGTRARIRLYLTHDKVGAELLREAGSHPFTVAWAEQHHWAPERWTVDGGLAQALKDADGD